VAWGSQGVALVPRALPWAGMVGPFRAVVWHGFPGRCPGPQGVALGWYGRPLQGRVAWGSQGVALGWYGRPLQGRGVAWVPRALPSSPGRCPGLVWSAPSGPCGMGSQGVALVPRALPWAGMVGPFRAVWHGLSFATVTHPKDIAR